MFNLNNDTKKLAIGLMSGTSADGIDAALVEISGCSTTTKVRQLAFVTLPFTDAVRNRILRVAAGDFGGSKELCLLNFLMGRLSADACLAVCAQAGVDPHSIAFVGSHGQTVYHAPTAEEYCGYNVNGTLQIGEASLICEALGCTVVSDFRVRDMAAGGLGAPLVPYTEYLCTKTRHVPWRCKTSVASATSQYCQRARGWRGFLPLTPARETWSLMRWPHG